MQHRSRVAAGLAAELVFAFLPLLVILLVFYRAGRAGDWVYSTEWAFAAAILFGQSIVKFMSGLSRGGRAAAGPVALTLALLLVFGLVPALFILTVSLTTPQGEQPLSVGFTVAQIALFVAASAAYLILGTIGETWNPQTPDR
jgi:hypothetical protein